MALLRCLVTCPAACCPPLQFCRAIFHGLHPLPDEHNFPAQKREWGSHLACLRRAAEGHEASPEALRSVAELVARRLGEVGRWGQRWSWRLRGRLFARHACRLHATHLALLRPLPSKPNQAPLPLPLLPAVAWSINHAALLDDHGFQKERTAAEAWLRGMGLVEEEDEAEMQAMLKLAFSAYLEDIKERPVVKAARKFAKKAAEVAREQQQQQQQ